MRSAPLLLLLGWLAACAPRLLVNPATYGIRGGVDLASGAASVTKVDLAAGEAFTASVAVEDRGALDCYDFPTVR